jgi:glycosyltransferase involved in cell wall biosynthesis
MTQTRPLRLLLDLQPLQGPSNLRGIGRYCRGFVNSLLKKFPDNEYYILFNRELPIPNQYLNELSRDLAFSVVYFNGNGRSSSEEVLYSRELLLHDLRVDGVLIMSFFEDDRSVYSSINAFEFLVDTYVLMHDIIPLSFHEKYLPTQGQLIRYLNRLSQLSQATAIFTVSEYVKNEIEEVIPGAKGRTFTIYGGVDDFFVETRPVNQLPQSVQLSKLPPVGGHYVVYVAGSDFRKNLTNYLLALDQLSDEVINKFNFLIVGEVNTPEMESVRAKISERTFEAVRVIGRISDSELKDLYTHAATAVFPSLSEGLGLPLLEAVACGTSVLSSNNTSLGELNKVTSATFDPSSPGDIARVLEVYLRDGSRRTELASAQAALLKEFRWDSCVRRFVEAVVGIERLSGTHSSANPTGHYS